MRILSSPPPAGGASEKHRPELRRIRDKVQPRCPSRITPPLQCICPGLREPFPGRQGRGSKVDILAVRPSKPFRPRRNLRSETVPRQAGNHSRQYFQLAYGHRLPCAGLRASIERRPANLLQRIAGTTRSEERRVGKE